jgi:hypothetical protein
MPVWKRHPAPATVGAIVGRVTVAAIPAAAAPAPTTAAPTTTMPAAAVETTAVEAATVKAATVKAAATVSTMAERRCCAGHGNGNSQRKCSANR